MLIFAHRGDSGTEPENTLSAINAALSVNTDGIEIDIHQVEDKLVVIHDRWLQRTTSGMGLVKTCTFNELRALDAGKGQKIPTLDEVLSLTANKCLLNIELKGIDDLGLLFNYLDNAKQTDNFDFTQLILSSFNHQILSSIHQQRPEFTLGAITACCPLDYAKFAERLNVYSVHVDINVINEDFVNDAHQRGLKVFIYTVDELEDIKAMKEMAVDGIFTNHPKITQYFLKQTFLG